MEIGFRLVFVSGLRITQFFGEILGDRETFGYFRVSHPTLNPTRSLTEKFRFPAFDAPYTGGVYVG